MNENVLTKKVLEKVANELSKVMDFENPIEVADDMTDTDLLRSDIVEAAGELRDDDEITEKSKEVLFLLGVELPWETVKKEVEKKDIKKPVKKEVEKKDIKKPVKKEVKKKEENKKVKNYTRVQAFCDALIGKAKTITEITEKAKELYDKANPGKEESKLSYIEWDIRTHHMPALIILGFVELKDKKYSLKDK